MLSPDVEASFATLIDAFCGPSPLPAGGAAAVAAIAMGTGVGLKVIAISRVDDSLDQVAGRLEELSKRDVPAFTADCAAFSDLLEALRLPKDDATRAARVATGWQRATSAPVEVAVRAREVEELLTRCAGRVKPSVLGDLGAALELVGAGRRIAESNARENAQRLDPRTAAELLAPLD